MEAPIFSGGTALHVSLSIPTKTATSGDSVCSSVYDTGCSRSCNQDFYATAKKASHTTKSHHHAACSSVATHITHRCAYRFAYRLAYRFAYRLACRSTRVTSRVTSRIASRIAYRCLRRSRCASCVTYHCRPTN